MKKEKKPSQFLEIFLNEIGNVRANRYMSEADKKAKISQLQRIINDK